MIQSVNRAIDLLQAVAGRSQGAGVSELARACDLKVQTAQTLLKTLAFRNLLAFDTRHRMAPTRPSPASPAAWSCAVLRKWPRDASSQAGCRRRSLRS